MQDVRILLRQLREISDWVADFAAYLVDEQKKIEEVLEAPWRHERLEQLWQAMQTPEFAPDVAQEFDQFLKRKPLTSWLEEAPEELCAELVPCIEPWPTNMEEATALELLTLAFASPVESGDVGHVDTADAFLTDWLSTFVAEAEPLWPAQQLVDPDTPSCCLLTPLPQQRLGTPMSQYPHLPEAERASRHFLGTRTEQNQLDQISLARSDASVGSQNLAALRQWCAEQPGMEWSESTIDGLLIVVRAATDLEVPWV